MSLETIFMQHIAEHALSYGTIEEFNFRAKLFAELDEELNLINSIETTFTVGHNFLSTWTAAEKKRLNGFNGLGEKSFGEMLPEANAASVDWREPAGKYVNPVKDQAQCGSCWAFSATAAMETEYAIKNGSLPNLSEEQLVQCSKRNNGCNGGSMALAFRYLETHYQNTEAKYPYSSGHGKTGSCDTSLENGKVDAVSYHNVKQDNPTQLKAAIAQGVVSVAIEADKSVFQNYKSGVMSSPLCGTNLDHGVAAVGYGSENGQEYIIVRNSWGPTWGDQGYIKIGVEDGKGVCGINMEPVYPDTN